MRAMLLARLVRLAAVIYLVTHGVPVGAGDPADLAQTVVRHLAGQVTEVAVHATELAGAALRAMARLA